MLLIDWLIISFIFMHACKCRPTMWYDQAKSVLSRWHILSFLHNIKLHHISYIFAKNPIKIGHFSSRDMIKCRVWKTIGNDRSCFLWWAISYNQYCQQTTDAAWSCHKWRCSLGLVLGDNKTIDNKFPSNLVLYE